MNCPACDKNLTAHYNTIFTCDNRDCAMLNAILSKEQWEIISRLQEALNFCIDEIEKWNAGKTHDIGAAFEAAVTAVAEAKA